MNRSIVGDCRDVLRELVAQGVRAQCVVTSPPYWGLRDYGIPPSVWGGDPSCAHEWGPKLSWHKGGPHGDGVLLEGGRSVVEAQAACKDVRAGQFCQKCGAWLGCFGLEPTYVMYVEHSVEIFRLVWDVLADDGVLWLNLGDTYHNGDKAGYAKDRIKALDSMQRTNLGANFIGAPNRIPQPGLKNKDLIGIPWRVAFALQADGWWLRQDNIWHKKNPMPESVRDRCTKAHEYIFLLSKSERYYYNNEAISEPVDGRDTSEGFRRNKRSVWTIPTSPFPDAHFATFPPALVEPCILAGSRPGDLVLDPFGGSGTVGEVAGRLGRQWVLIDINPDYARMQRERTRQPGLAV